MILIIVLLWSIAFLLQVYKHYINYAIKFSITRGESPEKRIPLHFWKKNRFAIFKAVIFFIPIIILLLNYVGYGLVVVLVTALIISMIYFGLGKFWPISIESKIQGY